jgi:hypothetical protein
MTANMVNKLLFTKRGNFHFKRGAGESMNETALKAAVKTRLALP